MKKKNRKNGDAARPGPARRCSNGCEESAAVPEASGHASGQPVGTGDLASESEFWYRMVANFASDWESWFNPEGRILYLSPSAETLLQRPVGGYTGIEALLHDVVHPDDLPARLAHLSDELKGKGSRDMDFRVVRPDGEVRWVHHVCRPVYDDTGKFLGTRGSNRDVTERHAAEDALHRSEIQMRADLEAMKILQKIGMLYIHEGNLEHILTEIVDAAIAITGSDFGNIQLIDPQSSDLRIAAQRNFPEWWIDFWNTSGKGKGACGTALRRGERVIIEDVEQSPIFTGTPALDIQRRAGVRAVTSTPLMSRKGVLLGMFSTHFSRPHKPDDRQLRLLDLLARQAGDIIERAQSATTLRESEERQRLLAETMLQGVVHQSANGSIISMNPAAEQILGKTPEEFLGKTSEGVENDTIREDGSPFPGIDHPAMVALRTGKQVRQDVMGVFNPREKAYRWISIDAIPLFRPGEPRPSQVYTVFEDITERRKGEESLRQIEAERTVATTVETERKRLYDVLEALPVYVCLIDADYRMPFANRYFRETFAKPAGRRCYEFLFHRDTPCETCETHTVMKTRAPHHWFWTGPNGRDYDIYDFPFIDTDGAFMILEMGIDITEQRKAEHEVIQANAYNRSLIEASLDPLVTISPDGTISDVNEATIRVTGFSRQELVGTVFSDYFTEPAKAKAGYETVFREGSVTDYPLEIRHRDGHMTPVLYNASVYRDASGEVTGVFAAARDVTELKKAEDAARKAYELLEERVKERTAELAEKNVLLRDEVTQRRQAESLVKKTVSELQAAIESTADGIYAVDRAGKIIRYNQNFASMWKIPDDVLRGGDDRNVTAYIKNLVKNPALFTDCENKTSRIKDRETYDMLELNDGRIFEWYTKPQKMDSSIIGRVSSYRDVTERKRAEEKLLQSLQEKETLIREIHHRVKNNLQIISGLLDMTRMRTPDSATHSVLTDMMMKIKTMAQIHTRLYESKQFDRINMGSQIRDQVADLSTIYGREGAEIETVMETQEIYLPVDQAIPCALIVNEVLSNAFKHAFRGKRHGTLSILAEKIDSRVRIVIQDDGVGIPHDIDVCKTPSLGLKLIRSLALQLGGSVEIAHNGGTHVVVEFPIGTGR